MLTQAFELALNGAAAAKGEREKLTLRGTPIDMLAYDAGEDFVAGDGGSDDIQRIRVSCRITEVPNDLRVLGKDTDPESATFRGRDIPIIKVQKFEGRTDLVLGFESQEID